MKTDSHIVVDGLMGGILTPRVIDRLLDAHVTAINLTAVRIGATLGQCLQDLAAVREVIDANPRRLRLVETAADIREAKTSGRVGIILGLQDAEPIGRDLFLLRTLRDIGVRIIQITHNKQSFVGTGCVERDSGLTTFGRKLVAEMNRLGMAVDLSHCGPRTTMEAIECADRPVLITHSNPSRICPSPRNKDDDIIKALAARNGILGLAAWSPLLYRGNHKRPTLADLTACVDHVIDLVGPDHVAIGTDLCDDLTPTRVEWEAVYGSKGHFPEVSGGLGDWYAFETNMAAGLDTIEDMPNLTRELIQRGYSQTIRSKILGENFIRAFERATSTPI